MIFRDVLQDVRTNTLIRFLYSFRRISEICFLHTRIFEICFPCIMFHSRDFGLIQLYPMNMLAMRCQFQLVQSIARSRIDYGSWKNLAHLGWNKVRTDTQSHVRHSEYSQSKPRDRSIANQCTLPIGRV
ncbi:MAG: hypothetical protein DWQ09_13855 [Proteobacteria bacterium]|nr:MAG: hypothetical protein DWQ09_13855 [Pseudomonadota bacterium]